MTDGWLAQIINKECGTQAWHVELFGLIPAWDTLSLQDLCGQVRDVGTMTSTERQLTGA